MKKLGLVHTSATLAPQFADLCAECLPGVSVFNIADDSLIKEVIATGELTTGVARRVVSQVVLAHEAGADQIMVTCSSVGPAVELAAKLVDTPVLRVDQPMADEAVRLGVRIGVAATLPTTLAPTADLIERRAQLAGKEIEITDCLCEGAFEALMSGDSQTHDDRVAEALTELAGSHDVIVLAQASMARVVSQVQGIETPILSSPRLAVEFLAEQAAVG